MAKLSYNKSVLNQQKKQLQTYQRFLPALELKQQQLMAEKKKADRELAAARETLEVFETTVYEQLPMLGCEEISLDGLVTVDNVTLGEEYLVGVVLPVLDEVTITAVPYGLLARPHWVDNLVTLLQQVLQLRLEIQVLEQRQRLLQKAAKAATQRVNLFAKILIPEAEETIRRIGVFLSDSEAAAVVRAKMTKQKHRHHAAQSIELGGVS